MKIIYELYDQDCNLLLHLEGEEYIAPIGCKVLFDEMEISFNTCFELMGKVTSHMYFINNDLLCVNCEIIEGLSKHDLSNIKRYNNYQV